MMTEIPISGPAWDVDGLVEWLCDMSPRAWVQLHWGLYFIVHSDEHEQANISCQLFAWDWIESHPGQEPQGVIVTL
jgi:hypothetical protein